MSRIPTWFWLTLGIGLLANANLFDWPARIVPILLAAPAIFIVGQRIDTVRQSLRQL